MFWIEKEMCVATGMSNETCIPAGLVWVLYGIAMSPQRHPPLPVPRPPPPPPPPLAALSETPPTGASSGPPLPCRLHQRAPLPLGTLGSPTPWGAPSDAPPPWGLHQRAPLLLGPLGGPTPSGSSDGLFWALCPGSSDRSAWSLI